MGRGHTLTYGLQHTALLHPLCDGQKAGQGSHGWPVDEPEQIAWAARAQDGEKYGDDQQQPDQRIRSQHLSGWRMPGVGALERSRV